MRATIPCHPPVSTMPRMGMSSAPNQMRKNWRTSLKIAELIGGTRPAQQLERAKVRRDESQAGDPRGHLAAGQKEIFAGLCESLQIKADSQNQKEIESDDDKVDFG